MQIKLFSRSFKNLTYFCGRICIVLFFDFTRDIVKRFQERNFHRIYLPQSNFKIYLLESEVLNIYKANKMQILL